MLPLWTIIYSQSLMRYTEKVNKENRPITQVRAISAKVVYLVAIKKQSLSTAFPLETQALSPKDRAFAQELCYGTLRFYFRLKAITKLLLHSPLKTNDLDVECLLLVGVYQILFTRVPEYAAVSETVSATKDLGKIWAKALLNKILRRVITEKETLLSQTEKNEEAHFSHPQWIINLLKKTYPEKWVDILNANNAPAPLYLRINSQKIARDEYLALLEEKNIQAEALSTLDQAIKLKEPIPVSLLPGFKEGFCSVQDASGQRVEKLLDVHKKHRVLDACAAPGSKACHILETHPDINHFAAIDSDSDRLLLVKENLTRLEIRHEHIHMILADASHVKEWWDGTPFDRILVDAPCSSTGVIRRHPDIKLLRQPSDIAKLAQQQQHLLKALWPLLAKNGLLLYTTCSILPEENQTQIQHFIQQQKDATPVPLSIPEAAISTKYGTQCLPQKEGPDGFFYALIKKD